MLDKSKGLLEQPRPPRPHFTASCFGRRELDFLDQMVLSTKGSLFRTSNNNGVTGLWCWLSSPQQGDRFSKDGGSERGPSHPEAEENLSPSSSGHQCDCITGADPWGTPSLSCRFGSQSMQLGFGGMDEAAPGFGIQHQQLMRAGRKEESS